MNFGSIGALELIFVLAIWILPLVLVIWFVRKLAGMAASLRAIDDRLGELERRLRDATTSRHS
jgi:hypothetical protein